MARQMKDSGVEWIGQIPEDWDVARLCDIKSEKKFAIVDGPFGSAISTNDYREKGVPLIRISNLKNGEVSDEDMVYISEELAESVRRSCIGLSDIVFAKTGATIGKCGINRLIKYGILASSCIKISISHKYNCDYFYYIFSTDQFNQALRNTCTGTTRDTINLTPFSKLNVLLPPYCIQNRIASYLDRKCAQIDAIIAKQQQIIEKLKEYKLSVITEAVTKGLDPNVPMKDSGVEWIGKIPKHWNVAKMKFVASFFNGDRSSKYPSGTDIVDTGVIFVTSNNLGNIILNKNVDTKYITKEKYDDLGGAKLRINDIIFCLRGSVGKCSINKTESEGTIASSLVVIRAKKIPADYLIFVLQCPGITAMSMLNAIGIGSLNLSAEDISEIFIPVPSQDDAKQIAEFLERKIKVIDKMINKKTDYISKLIDYKKSLIYEVVTGKKEV